MLQHQITLLLQYDVRVSLIQGIVFYWISVAIGFLDIKSLGFRESGRCRTVKSNPCSFNRIRSILYDIWEPAVYDRLSLRRVYPTDKFGILDMKTISRVLLVQSGCSVSQRLIDYD